MTIIQVRNVDKSYGDKQIFKSMSFDIKKGEKIGLVGWNGTGKTTLVKLLMGFLHPDKGTVKMVSLNRQIGYLPQSTDYTIDYHIKHKNGSLLHQTSELGLEKIYDWEDIRFDHLSGGEKLKLSLAEIWEGQPSILILDEPTNHLDLQGINWLIEKINSFEGSAIIISHDRYFLDKIVSKIMEIEDFNVKEYKGNYTTYQELKKMEREKHRRDYEKQQNKISLIYEQIATLKQWSTKGHREAGKTGVSLESGIKEYGRVQAKKKDKQIKSKLNRLELQLSQDEVEKPKDETSISFQFEADGKRGKRILEAQNVSKTFGQKILFQSSYFYVKQGEKIGLFGSNGAGKTTFIKMLLGQEEVSSGKLWKSESLKIAYLSQDVNDLPVQKSALEFLDIPERERISKARTILANMGLKNKQLSEPMETLSLGQRTRVKLVYMILQDYDVLILDEPTNHLDLPSREQLEETLKYYTGTLIIVSHDHYFMEKLCDKLLIIENKEIKRIEMGLKEYEERKNRKSAGDSQEELWVIETKITELLGKLPLFLRDTEEYQRINGELIALMSQKNTIIRNK
ncbi:ribosomal protection-like ABC-F family protein [Evansella tamaricis]|uniref:ABC-F type ribosomal protection protein n=1 Tax=Evansella tamaricis TaxID=2069301 RepID=A0ABS6JHI9_9BACI|nr:ABC-F type ribosomal protection protein [Evansella tamaricis]MBU9713129.1 ABC-F type ribosomal protection protein [Evansella tamaricis]